MNQILETLWKIPKLMQGRYAVYESSECSHGQKRMMNRDVDVDPHERSLAKSEAVHLRCYSCVHFKFPGA